MVTTEEGHHRLEVESAMAKQVAGQILSMLDVDPAEVTGFEVEIESNGCPEGETHTTIDSDGPRAGYIVAPMLRAADWDDNEPRQITVHVRTTEAADSDPEAEPDEDDGNVESDDGRPHTDEDTVTKVSVGTNAHAGLTAIAAYIYKKGKQVDSSGGYSIAWTDSKPGVSVSMILELVDTDLTRDQLSDALDYCAGRGILENVGPNGPGTANYYHVTQAGWYNLREEGPSDKVEDFPVDELVSTRLSGTTGFTYESPDRGEHGRETPDVDEPQEVSPGTRPHQALTVLAKITEDRGEDEWFTVREIYEYDDGPSWPNQTAASKSLSDLFLQHALCKRKKVTEDGKMINRYQMNDAGYEELERIGLAKF